MINKAHQNKRLSIQYSIKIPASHMSELSQASVSNHWTGIKMIFYSHVNKTHFHKKSFSLSLPCLIRCGNLANAYLLMSAADFIPGLPANSFTFSSLPLNALFCWASTLKCPCHLMTSGVRFPFLL